MPWYNGKFFYERDNINLRTSQRFDALPTQNNLLDDLLVFNNTTNEVNSRTVASLGAVGATGPRGLDGNSSLWEFKDSGSGQPGAGEFRFDGGNTFGDGELYINVIDNLGNDMTNWLQNFAYGDVLVLRSYDSYNEFAIYQIKDSGFTSTISNNIITIPLTVANVTNPTNELIDAFGSGVSGQGGSFAVNSLCTIGYVKGGIKGLAGNSSIWVYTNSGPNLPTLPSSRFTIGANATSWNFGLGIILSINFTDDFQTNMSTWLTSINVGDIIYIREYISNFTNFVYYKVDSIGSNATYINFTVTHIESNSVGNGASWNNNKFDIGFIPAGAQGAQGLTGATGATGAQGPAGPGSVVSNGTISFWSELGGQIGGSRGGPTAPMRIVIAGPSGAQNQIWPILPHGGGAFRDTWGTYIGGEGIGLRTPNSNSTSTYGEYMPFDGKVYAYGINFDNYSGAVSLPVSYDIFVMNYTTGDIQLTTTVTGGPSSVSVIAGAGVPSLGFSAGDHIGLAVKYAGGLRCYMAVEGTIYFEYSYP